MKPLNMTVKHILPFRFKVTVGTDNEICKIPYGGRSMKSFLMRSKLVYGQKTFFTNRAPI